MRHGTRVVALATLLGLAACGDVSAPTNSSLPANIADLEANAPVPAGPPIVEASYTCDPAMALAVRYDSSNPHAATAQATLDGSRYDMVQVPAADGAKYMASTGREPGKTLVWWNRGNGGTLFEGSTSDPAAPETQLATCTEGPPPTQ